MWPSMECRDYTWHMLTANSMWVKTYRKIDRYIYHPYFRKDFQILLAVNKGEIYSPEACTRSHIAAIMQI